MTQDLRQEEGVGRWEGGFPGPGGGGQAGEATPGPARALCP